MATDNLKKVTALQREGRVIIWTESDISLLKQLYPTTSTRSLAKAFGVSEDHINCKALDYNLAKAGIYPDADVENEIITLFNDFSIREIAESLDISVSMVRAVVKKHNLTKSTEQINDIKRRKRYSLIKKEHARGVFGFEAKSNIRVFRNDKKSKARSRLRESGYLVDRTSSTVYYDENTVRSSRREAFARKLGFVFLPYRDEYEEEAV